MKRVLSVFLSLIMALCGVSVVANAYNPANAVYYAQLFWDSKSPPYFNYYGDDADCTNFVSSCLWNGGFATMNDTSGKSFGVNNESTEWYSVKYQRYDTFFGINYNYRDDWKTSTTWVRVYNTGNGKGLYQFLADTKGLTVIRSTYLEDIINYADVGDVIQCGINNENPGHSIIVGSKTMADLGIYAHSNPQNDCSFTRVYYSYYDYFYIFKIQ